MQSYKSYLGGGLLGLALLSGAVLTAPRANADTSGTVDITVNVPTACSLSATNNTLTKTINPGTSDTIGTSNIKALCNDANGFAIYAVGYTDEEYGNNYLTTSLGDDYKIATGKAASPSTSQWNMTIDNDSDVTGDYVATIENDFDQASIIPDTYTKIASFASATDQSIGSNLTATFDAYIASNQAAGTYTGKVKFTLVHPSSADAPEAPCLPGTICYRRNSASLGIMNDQEVSVGETTLISPNYLRYGYGFAGWNTEPDGTGTQYGPNEIISTPENDSEGFVLYANWKKAEDGITMQTFNPSSYSASPSGTILALRDERDNEVYAVAKLADGRWWMIENLRLDPSEAGTVVNASNTNNPTSAFLAGVANVQNGSDTTIWKTCATYDSACSDQVSIGLGNIKGNSEPAYGGTSQDTPWYSYGVMYNWFTATAGNGTYNKSSGEVSGDICPIGWRLPNGGNYDSLITSVGATSSNQMIRYPNNIALSGLYAVTGAQGRMGEGAFWNSTTWGSGQAYVTNFNVGSDNNRFHIENTAAKFLGFPVRCIAD